MTSEVEERPRLVTAGYGWHRSQWLRKKAKNPNFVEFLAFLGLVWIAVDRFRVYLNAYAGDQQLYSSDSDHVHVGLYNQLNDELSIAVDWFKHMDVWAILKNFN